MDAVDYRVRFNASRGILMSVWLAKEFNNLL